jgi:hypothetical protein
MSIASGFAKHLLSSSADIECAQSFDVEYVAWSEKDWTCSDRRRTWLRMHERRRFLEVGFDSTPVVYQYVVSKDNQRYP